MSGLIKCPICGKMTRPDYCSDECLYRDYERDRIIKMLESYKCTCKTNGLCICECVRNTLVFIKGNK